MVENEKSSKEDVSIKDIVDRLSKIESHLSQEKVEKSHLLALRQYIAKTLTRENIEFLFSLLALIISISVAAMLLRQ